MRKSNLQPPREGLNANPILYGVAAGLAELFPPVASPKRRRAEREEQDADPRDPRDERREPD